MYCLRAEKRMMKTSRGFLLVVLLNCLDGIAHADKQIIIMTTNCKMVLDKALTRPGRIDVDLEFKYANKKQIKTMFEKFLRKSKR